MSTLAIKNVKVVYDNATEALRDTSMTVEHGHITTLLGSNGAGKSTLLKAISGILYPEKGEITAGMITYGDHELNHLPADKIVSLGLVQVPEGRALFRTLSVEENLTMGGYMQPRTSLSEGLDQVYALFPAIANRRAMTAGYLSGGEQQMVAIGRALMARPKLMMLDEPSLGLAPLLVDKIFEVITRINHESKITILLVEQNAERALDCAHYGYVMENGRIVLDGTSERLMRDSDIRHFYLGLQEGKERRSMRDVKHYKRRKRWIS